MKGMETRRDIRTGENKRKQEKKKKGRENIHQP